MTQRKPWYYDNKPSNKDLKYNYKILRFLGLTSAQARNLRDWRKTYINKYILENNVLFNTKKC